MATYGEFLVPFWKCKKHPRMITHFHLANFTDDPIYWRFQLCTETGELERDHVSLIPGSNLNFLPDPPDGVSVHFFLPTNCSTSLQVASANLRGHGRGVYALRQDVDHKLVGFGASMQRIHVVSHIETHEHREESSSSKAAWFVHRPLEGAPLSPAPYSA